MRCNTQWVTMYKYKRVQSQQYTMMGNIQWLQYITMYNEYNAHCTMAYNTIQLNTNDNELITMCYNNTIYNRTQASSSMFSTS